MSGKLCDGVAAHTQKIIKNSKAYCEGAEHRFADTALNNPITDNPHEASSEARASWDAGWNDANTGAVEGCCAGPNRTAP